MNKRIHLKSILLASAGSILFASASAAGTFDIPGGDLKSALKVYSVQSGIPVVVSDETVKGISTTGVRGDLSSSDALTRILSGTGFTASHDPSGVIAIVPRRASSNANVLTQMQLAQATPAPHAVETVTVTSSKLGGGDVQSIPISITALSQEQLTASQTNGGPDLIKQVPNMTFTKTNFAGYSIQLRGIGTQAISVTTDPAVAVAFNDQPFIRNHFFEQEFFDVAQVQVLRGPQGTLYGRNATAGVVNITSAKPTDQFEAMASAEVGNYKQKRFEGMINLPIVDDRLALRVAGEWTKRDGYTFNRPTNDNVDGRNLWSARATLGWKPSEKLQANFVWEHFSEDDDRLRSAKQLCTTDPTPDTVGGQSTANAVGWSPFRGLHGYLSQGCKMGSLYADAAFGVPDSYSLPYYLVMDYGEAALPYASNRQSTDLRVIDSELTPKYKAKNDTVQLNVNYKLSPSLTFISDTGFNHDFLYSTQDYNRFASASGVFTKPVLDNGGIATFNPDTNTTFMCDPQLGCSDKLIALDLTQQKSWQANQEFRLASSFSGPFNFSVGGNYMHYETIEDYYVFINSMTMSAWNWGGDLDAFPRGPWVVGVSDNGGCLARYGGYKYNDPTKGGGEPSVNSCIYIDPNPISSLNGNGHNYFRSQNPYVLNSYAAFGEAYYDVSPDLKLTTGLRWTQDQKHFTLIPSQLATNGWGYPSNGAVDQQWDAITGRAAINWTPKLSFTDQTLVFGSYAHGYKAGGANPPGPVLPAFALGDANPIHPLTFKPEYIDAFELGTKNTLFDGSLTFNSSIFYYNYKGYQISEIVDRTAINLNFDAKVKGAEIETTWEPLPGLRFNASGGYQEARANKGESAVDLMDRTAGNTDWMVVRPFPTQASNCILPVSVVAALLEQGNFSRAGFSNLTHYNSVLSCSHAYTDLVDPVTQLPYTATLPLKALGEINNTANLGHPMSVPSWYTGFNPLTAPNGGAGFSKDLSRHTLPNAPPFTLSVGAQYSMPVTDDWAGTLRTDFYWQDDSWARIFNDNPYDRIRSYTNLNLTVMLTSQSGWQVMGYIKNVLDTTAITGAFLNSDDSNLTTNVFLTDPRLIGVRVTKNW